MDLVKGFMKKEESSSTKSVASSKRSKKSDKLEDKSSSHTASSVSAESTLTESSLSLNYKSILKVQKSWDELTTVSSYQSALGDALMCHMKTSSKPVGPTMVDTLNSIIPMISPEMEEMELLDLTSNLKKEGVDPALMFGVLPLAIADVSKSSSSTQKAWETVCDSLCSLLK